MASVEDLAQELEAARQEVEAAQQEYQAFRKRVVERAMREGRERGGSWCSDLREVLEDLDLGEKDGLLPRHRTVTIREFTVSVEIDEDGEITQRAVDRAAKQWITDELTVRGWDFAA